MLPAQNNDLANKLALAVKRNPQPFKNVLLRNGIKAPATPETLFAMFIKYGESFFQKLLEAYAGEMQEPGMMQGMVQKISEFSNFDFSSVLSGAGSGGGFDWNKAINYGIQQAPGLLNKISAPRKSGQPQIIGGPGSYAPVYQAPVYQQPPAVIEKPAKDYTWYIVGGLAFIVVAFLIFKK
jgi:hypothetical protein